MTKYTPYNFDKLLRGKTIRINKMISKGKGFDLLSNSVDYSLRRWKEIRMENVSVNIRAFNSKGGKRIRSIAFFPHLFTKLINNLPLISTTLDGRDIAIIKISDPP